MAKIRVRFAASDELARVRPCENSGSDDSADNSADLSELIKSFMETDGPVEDVEDKREDEESGFESENRLSDSEAKEMLERLLGCDDVSNADDDVKRMIRRETELACRVIGTSSSEGLKRRLMSRLRERGLDAGLCKSRWEKIGRFPAGDYEYIVVVAAGSRYIVEVALAGEFSIARPTDRYLSFLEVLPQIFVGKPEELKQVVRLMCAGARESMKSMDMHVPPWRKNRYMQARWFSQYKRTTKAIPGRKAPVTEVDLACKRELGFERSPASFNYWRGALAGKVGLKGGNLAAAFNGDFV